MDGYHKVAAIMADYPDLCILRRFRRLNVRNLLFLQAELVHLEDDLKHTVLQDNASKEIDQVRLQYDFQALLDSADNPEVERRDQWRLTVELKQKLKEFNEAVLLFSTVCRLPSAHDNDVQSLRRYLDKARDENPLFMSNRERWTWADRNDRDFMSLANNRREEDVLTTWINRELIPMYHKAFCNKSKEDISFAAASGMEKVTTVPLQHYSDTAAAKLVNTISTALSSLWPTTAIFALYFIKPPLARMSAIMAFTFLFSVMVTMMTRARRVDCFTATAAFAAVLVVFVGNNGPSCGIGSTDAGS